jgi:hypothetical protein
MKRIRRQIANILLFALFAAFPTSANTPLFSVTLDAPKASLKSGAKLILRVTVTNTSDHNIPFKRTPNPISNEEFRYQIEIRDADGQPAPPSARVRALQGQIRMTEDWHNHAYWLKPGESYSDDLEITKFYDLDKPGIYTVSVSKDLLTRQYPVALESIVKSNAVTITVVP